MICAHNIWKEISKNRGKQKSPFIRLDIMNHAHTLTTEAYTTQHQTHVYDLPYEVILLYLFGMINLKRRPTNQCTILHQRSNQHQKSWSSLGVQGERAWQHDLRVGQEVCQHNLRRHSSDSPSLPVWLVNRGRRSRWPKGKVYLLYWSRTLVQTAWQA